MNFKEYLILFFPIALMTFSTNLFPAIEKIFLANLSKEDMEASLSAFYAVQIFQLTSVSLTMMAQVFVGRWYGEKQWEKIGPGTWQFIWFSLFFFIISLPLGYFYGKFYFKGTLIEGIVFPYYHSLLGMSFLFPLGGTLTCFFLGQGRTGFIFIVTLICHLIKLPIGYAFIFGWSWIPRLGLMGGALSIFITQLCFCLILLAVFLNQKNHQLYCTRKWNFQKSLFWECIQPGILRATNRMLSMGNWGAITYFISQGGEKNLLVLSVGGTLGLMVGFIADAICLAQISLVSQLLGSKNYHSLYRAFFPGTILAIAGTLLVSINLLIFPSWTFEQLFPSIMIQSSVIKLISLGVWLSSALCMFSFLPVSYILAFKDTSFSVLMGGLNWFTGFLFIYTFMTIFHFSVDYFWVLFAFFHASTGIAYYLRTKWLIAKVSMQELPV